MFYLEYGALQPDGSIPSYYSSSNSLNKTWSPPPNQKDDLYSWMAKAHNETKNNSAKNNDKVEKSNVAHLQPQETKVFRFFFSGHKTTNFTTTTNIWHIN